MTFHFSSMTADELRREAEKCAKPRDGEAQFLFAAVDRNIPIGLTPLYESGGSRYYIVNSSNRKDLMQLTSVKYYIQTVTINSGVHETRLDAFPVDELSNVTFKSSGAIASIGK